MPVQTKEQTNHENNSVKTYKLICHEVNFNLKIISDLKSEITFTKVLNPLTPKSD